MTRANYCEFFRFDHGYCDVFAEDNHYLYAVAEYCDYAGFLTCKEFRPDGRGGWIVSDYCNADAAYLANLEPAPADTARAIIASEERHTLECMAHEYGYTRQHVIDVCNECIADGDDPHKAFMYVASCMMERDL